jgi:hypothetical protein
VTVRRLVCLVLFVCAPFVAAAETPTPRSPRASGAASTTEVLDLSSPALFPAAAAFPTNIEAPPFIASLMRQMWVASPTFRRQCARIARAANGRIAIALRKPHSSEMRAASVIERRKAGVWVASVDVFIDRDLVEMIAHELEHVIEQIDGVDLPRLAQQGLAGVMTGSGEHYETARAVATGKRVAAEYATSRTRSAS